MQFSLPDEKQTRCCSSGVKRPAKSVRPACSRACHCPVKSRAP